MALRSWAKLCAGFGVPTRSNAYEEEKYYARYRYS